MIIALLCFATWWFGTAVFYHYLASNYDDDSFAQRVELVFNAGLWPASLFPYLIGTRRPDAGPADAGFRRTVLGLRTALLVCILGCMAVIAYDVAQRPVAKATRNVEAQTAIPAG